jgi:SAM-dependent methyltransferase
MRDTTVTDALRVERILGLIRESFGFSLALGAHDLLDGVSVLDLAALTGSISRGVARAGASVVAVEGRRSNIEGWPSDNPGVELYEGDVRDLGRPMLFDQPASGGRRFDVVLCLGVLYHLEHGDARKLLADVFMRTAPGGIAIIDTHVGGCRMREPGGMGDPWGSIGNTSSWWLDRDELVEVLLTDRFDQVDQLKGLAFPGEPASRAWFVAKRKRDMA